MPYVITTLAANFPAEAGHHTVSRQAVATLEEARWFAQRPGWRYTGADAEPAMEVYRTARALPESGGTVGPLPDGTTIEVEHLDWLEFADAALEAGVPGYVPMGRAAIDAFNAREATP